jgi:Family of unknown function (DUF6495)
MKYKRLGTNELKELEKEFIIFLSSAQIIGLDWDKMKKNEQEKAEELIDVFSDLVYEKVMSKIFFLEFRDKKELNIFHFEDDKIVLNGIRMKEDSSINLLSDDLFSEWNANKSNEISIIKTEKVYIKERGIEIFEMLEKGCYITDDKLFKAIADLY